MNSEHGLSERQLQILLDILKPYASEITQVDLFGSRATGIWRPESDIDLVIRGQLSEAALSRIWTRLDESSLPLKVDLQLYQHIQVPRLKAHIDAVAQPLFTQEDLRQAASGEASQCATPSKLEPS